MSSILEIQLALYLDNVVIKRHGVSYSYFCIDMSRKSHFPSKISLVPLKNAFYQWKSYLVVAVTMWLSHCVSRNGVLLAEISVLRTNAFMPAFNPNLNGPYRFIHVNSMKIRILYDSSTNHNKTECDLLALMKICQRRWSYKIQDYLCRKWEEKKEID